MCVGGFSGIVLLTRGEARAAKVLRPSLARCPYFQEEKVHQLVQLTSCRLGLAEPRAIGWAAAKELVVDAGCCSILTGLPG